jgi:hypothetical protein
VAVGVPVSHTGVLGSPPSMEAVTLTRPEPVTTQSALPEPAHGEAPPSPARRRPDLVRPALGIVLVTTLLLRLWGVKQGLPYSYNVDEATHFVPKAIAFFGHDLNPHYFLNPPAYSYVLHVVFAIWFGGSKGVGHAMATDPTSVYVVARVVAAVLGTLAVWITYFTGKRLFGREAGLVAAAFFGLAFLPIFYSHLALNDTPTLAPVALSLYGVAGVLRQGRMRDYVIAGVGIGLASATKYTGGITIVCLLGAFVADGARGGMRPAVIRLTVGLLVSLAAFLTGNPYALLDWNAFTHGVSSQASLAAGKDPVKLGTTEPSGITYYMWTFTWGFGWGPSLAALGGTILLIARKRISIVLMLLPAPVAFIIFMGTQQRYFGRWLMPVFPIAAVLAGYAVVELVRWLRSARHVPVLASGAVLAVLLLTQSIVSAVHADTVMSRPDTRDMMRGWMVSHVPAGARVVLEPAVPEDWTTDIGTFNRWTPDGERWWRFATWLTDVDTSGQLLPAGRRRFVLVDQYERTLRPALIDEYVNAGYCWVVTGSVQAGRAFAQPQAVPSAVAYYRELIRRARLVYQISPFKPGATPVTFNFDWSIDYYPPQYRYPGPVMSVYRLRGGRCG